MLLAMTDTKVLFTLYRGEEKVQEFTVNPLTQRGQKQMAEAASVPASVILKNLDAARSAQKGSAVRFDVPKTVSLGYPWQVRGEKEQDGEWQSTNNLAETIRKALEEYQGQEVIVKWKGKDALAALDVDYHAAGFAPPDADQLRAMVLTSLEPAPLFWHFTRRGGIHAFYEAGNGLTAEERAALGHLSWHLLDPTATCDIPDQVRPLPRGVKIEAPAGDPNGDVVHSWLSGGTLEAGNEEVDQFLETKGWTIGGRYPHEQCLIETGHASPGDPVEVTGRGVFCFRCQAKGLCHGKSKQPGFVSFGSLLGRVECTPIRQCVQNVTHWGHAKWVLQARTAISPHLLPVCYRAALKQYHRGKPSEKLIPLAFHKDTDWLVRGDGVWMTVEQDYQFPKDIDPLIACLPAVNMYDEEKEVFKAVASTVSLLSQPSLDLSDRGYQPVEVLKGMRLHADTSDNGRLVVTVPPSWMDGYGRDFHPRYLPIPKRLSEDAAKAVIERALPGINWTYVYALILARGANECRKGLHPFIITTGVSKAGKSSHVKIAASILGDEVEEVPSDPNTEKYRSAIREARGKGFITTDEFLKDALRLNHKLSPEQVLDPVLNMTPRSKSHKMYTGPTALGHFGVCVFTETDIPAYLKDYTQIARRMHFINLPDPVEWERPLVTLGLDDIHKLRCSSLEVANAMNSIVSWIIDKYFGTVLTFEQMATDIGVTTLQHSKEFEDLTPQLLEFFALVCEASEPSESDKKKFPRKGFKVIKRQDQDNPDLANVWSLLADGEQWHSSKRVKEKSFKQLLGTDVTIHFDITGASGGSTIAVRFRQGPNDNPTAVNGEILSPEQVRSLKKV